MNLGTTRLAYLAALVTASAVAIACTTSTTTTTTDEDAGTADSGKPKEAGTTADTGTGTGTGACSAECGDNICMNQSATTACSDCIDQSMGQGGACLNVVAKACAGNADCKAELECIGGCGKLDGGAPDSGSDLACFTGTDEKACTTCCETNHKTGDDFFYATLATCICGQ
jgi:hypothetical protein